MTDLSNLEQLLDRVVKVTGGDRAIDAALWLRFIPGVTRKQWSYTHKATNRVHDIDETRDETGRLIIVPAYTSSIDAAIAFINRVLPGWRICMEVVGDIAYDVYLLAPDYDDSRPEETSSGPVGGLPTALALLAAALSSLIVKEKAGG